MDNKNIENYIRKQKVALIDLFNAGGSRNRGPFSFLQSSKSKGMTILTNTGSGFEKIS